MGKCSVSVAGHVETFNGHFIFSFFFLLNKNIKIVPRKHRLIITDLPPPRHKRKMGKLLISLKNGGHSLECLFNLTRDTN